MTDWGTAAIPALVWVSMALLGIAVCGWALDDALNDWRYQQRRNRQRVADGALLTVHDEAYELTARHGALDELARVGMQIIAFLIGVYALSLQRPHVPLTRRGLVISGGLVLIEMILIVKSLHARHVRHVVLAMLRTDGRQT